MAPGNGLDPSSLKWHAHCFCLEKDRVMVAKTVLYVIIATMGSVVAYRLMLSFVDEVRKLLPL